MKGCCNIKRKHIKNSSGSITVEASFLLPLICIVIIMLVFLMIFYYNKLTLWKNTYYTGIKLVEAEREKTDYDLKTQWSRLSKDTLVLAENVQVSFKKTLTDIVVTGKARFTIPFWGKVDIEEKSLVPLCRGRESMVRSRLWERQVQNSED